MEAFFDEALAEALLRDIAEGVFVVQRQKPGARTAPSPGRAPPAATNAAAIEQALNLLADQIDLVSDASQRQQIAQQLQTLALAPDSPKARQGVLQVLAQSQTPRAAAETADFAGKPPHATAPPRAPTTKDTGEFFKP